ncbi:MAG: hypothetical protein EBR30_10945 [Cytophagia bacterium]|nr:hypothetical protein [Cytophagia bacterium]
MRFFKNTELKILIRFTTIVFIILALQLIGLHLHAQQPNIALSEKHLAKVEKIKSPAKKLQKYRKFYSKDSLKLFRQADRFISHFTDSVSKAKERVSAKQKLLQDKVLHSPERMEQRLQHKADVLQAKAILREKDYKLSKEWERYYTGKNLEALYSYMRFYLTEWETESARIQLPLNKSLAGKHLAQAEAAQSQVQNKLNLNDPLAKGKASVAMYKQELTSNKAINKLRQQSKKIEKYKSQAEAYKKVYGDLPTSKDGVIDFGESKLSGFAAQRKEMKEFESLKQEFGKNTMANPWENDYKAKADQLQDSTYLKEQARKKAEALAMQYIEDNPAVVEKVQKKMALLMKKYSVVPNSNDLSTAVKRSSLTGAPLRQRLHVATNFQVISIDPFSIDFAPALGYKFTRNFIAGIGGTYRETFTKQQTKLSPEVLGYKAFVSYDVIKSIFAYGEFANNSPGFEKTETGSHRIWKPALLAGAGRKFSVHRKVEMTCVVAYNFLHEANDPVYPRPLVVRVGFQLSELAMMKK